MRRIAFALVLFVPVCTWAQPLIDLLTVNGLVSNGLERTEISGTLPVKLDTTGRLLVFDPYFLQWRSTTSGDHYAPPLEGDVDEHMQGAGAALTYVTPLCSGRWKLAIAGISKYHWLEEQRHGEIQYGGVVLASRVFTPTLTVRAGTYFNNEAFGWFVMPLVGIDWRINEKTNLYGVLPGTMNFERKSTHWFHWGASFRAYTSSYGPRGGDYRRINDNPLGLYTDFYFTRHMVLRTEAGWCFFRRMLGGPGDPLYANEASHNGGYADHGIPEAAYVRVLLAYRLRLDQ